jgi:lysophospholipase L1-like esterase
MRKNYVAFGNLALIFTSTLFSLALAEILLRTFQEERKVYDHKLFCEYDPLLGWRKIPNASGIHVGPENEYRIRESMNSKGIRGPEYAYDKADEEYRIFVLGDSYAEGYTVEFDELFSEVLKRNLNKRHDRPIEVINTGTGGYSTDQELLLFKNEGVKYKPDLIVLLFCSNDVLFNAQERYWRGHKPLFQLQDGNLVLTNVPVPAPKPASSKARSQLTKQTKPGQAGDQPPFFHRVGTFFSANSQLYKRIHDALPRQGVLHTSLAALGLAEETPYKSAPKQPQPKQPKQQQKLKQKKPQKKAVKPDHFRLLHWKNATASEVDGGWEITDALLLELHKQTAQAGSQFLIFIVPGTQEVTQGVLSICENHGITCIDPTPRFNQEGNRLKLQGETLSFRLDGHWNRNGHKFAAQVMGDSINADYLSSVP